MSDVGPQRHATGKAGRDALHDGCYQPVPDARLQD